ncbi:MAG TPA: methyltransferase domain-containing protein [Sphingomonas sp.]|nr:methyltransferase domain-containing protein [Sphingomonas sp.]
MIATLRHIRGRRADLRRDIDVVAGFEQWEETCVPSYCHRNWFAAYVSWIRLYRAAGLAQRFAPDARRILDFGSSVGELGHLVSHGGDGYEFVEADDHAAAYLESRLPGARRTTLEAAPAGSYDAIFAIDSLEHNVDFAELLDVLATKLAPGGVFILSGPTENALYRLGRRIAGFDGHYHETTIYAIEAAASRRMTRIAARAVLPAAPLFRITAWSMRAH